MTTLFLKNNSDYEVSFVIFTNDRNDPYYTNTIASGCGLSLEFGTDTIKQIFTEDYYELVGERFSDPGNAFPDNEVYIYKLENYFTTKPTIKKPDNTLIGIEMRDSEKDSKSKKAKTAQKKKKIK